MRILTFSLLALLINASAASDADSAVEELAHHLARWHVAGTVDYVYEMRRIGSGAGSGVLVEILVRTGLVWDIRYQESSDYVSRNWSEEARKTIPEYTVGEMPDREEWQSYPTIHELFGIIAAALAEPVASIDVEYDDELGYPAEISIDFEETAADEEMKYVVENLKLLKPVARP